MVKAKITENKNENLIQKIRTIFLSYFNFIAVAAALLILAAGIYFIIMPKYRVIVEVVKTKNASNKNEYDSRVEYMNMIDKLKLSYEKIDQEKIKKIETFLPDEDYEDELYAKMESLAEENGMYLSSLTVGGDVAKDEAVKAKKDEATVQSDLPPELKKVNISMDLSGLDYNSFKSFLYAVESNLQLTDINKIAFSSSAGTLQLEMQVYYYATSKNSLSANGK